MSVVIKSVIKGSVADRKKIRAGYTLLSINAAPVEDVLDYSFYCKSDRLLLEVLTDAGRKKSIKIKKREDEDLGLEFDSYLMDSEQRCKNGCIFCFIDQLPKGMRQSLYFKDDDSRLSFLFGNYITLTNLTQRQAERIVQMHISPVNVSVHTMNPQLRVRMMKNKNAGECLKYLSFFAENNIKINAQLVLCPGVNDGDELRYSLDRLAALYPALESVAAVPVGLTKHRSGLYPLRGYDKDTAGEVIDIVEGFARSFYEKNGTRLAYCADEFYLKAQRPMPPAEHYEDFLQLENGVGMWASLKADFIAEIENAPSKTDLGMVSIATGAAAYPLISSLVELLKQRVLGLEAKVYEIKNDFFGHSITVAGLITGTDLIKQLSGRQLGRKLILPRAMLRSGEDVFLDDVTVCELSQALNVEVAIADEPAESLIRQILS